VEQEEAMNQKQIFVKRLFDVCISIISLFLLSPLLILLTICGVVFTRGMPFFSQTRIGQAGKPFSILKFRTMHSVPALGTVTTSGDSRITAYGRVLRKFKLDELPQLWNVLIGDMSIVGPRPDVPGYADLLTGEESLVLSVRPGITGPASLAFRNEEKILSRVRDPKLFNDTVIWPKKVKINLEYVKTYSFKKDIYYMIQTVRKI